MVERYLCNYGIYNFYQLLFEKINNIRNSQVHSDCEVQRKSLTAVRTQQRLHHPSLVLCCHV
jgi:hypothetical protein